MSCKTMIAYVYGAQWAKYGIDGDRIMVYVKRIVVVVFFIILSQVIIGQDSSIYVSKCRMYHSPIKSICGMLILHNDMSYRHIVGYSSDIPIISNGKYCLNNDTVAIIYDDFSDMVDVDRESGALSFKLTFVDFFNNSMEVDSILIYDANKIDIRHKVSDTYFNNADSIKFYKCGHNYVISNNYKEERVMNNIRIVLPVEHFIYKSNRKLHYNYSKMKYKKVN